jgi:hypothetical protein
VTVKSSEARIQIKNEDETNMNNETKTEFDQNAPVEIDGTELETIAASLRVRSGLQVGAAHSLIPCL